MWCIKEIDEEYRNRMYNILDLYAKDYRSPIISSCIVWMKNPNNFLMIIEKVYPMKIGSPERYDYEYKRKGKANIFVAVDFKGGKRDITVTDRRTKKDIRRIY